MEIGAKASHLVLLETHGFPVPPWKVLPADSEDIEPLLGAVKETQWGQGLMAVRSSALDEESTFQGQFETVLGVKFSALERAIARVRASAQNPNQDIPMAVIIQELIPAEISGAAYSCDPLSGDDDTVIIKALYGLGEGLSGGELPADTYRVRGNKLEQQLAIKTHQIVAMPRGGYSLRKVAAAKASQPALNSSQVRLIAQEVRRLQQALGHPQEVEWCLSRGKLMFLQARPLTSISGKKRVWDNRHTAANYEGVTTPLTFSFARHAHEHSFRQFCRTLGMPQKRIRRHRALFASMLGFFKGRVYYNMNSCYGVLSLLPGYSLTSRFMERVLELPRGAETPPPAKPVQNPIQELLSLCRIVPTMAYRWFTLGEDTREFRTRLSQTLAKLELNGENLVGHYREMEARLLSLWRVPLTNSFFALLFEGFLGLLVRRWLPREPGERIKELLLPQACSKAMEAALGLERLAAKVEKAPELRLLFEEYTCEQVWEHLKREPHAEFQRDVKRYLADFGDRCLGENKLETETLRERPEVLLSMLWARVQGGKRVRQSSLEQVRNRAEFSIFSKLSTWKRPLFRWVLEQARARLNDREEHRYERSRLHGLARKTVLTLGQQLVDKGVLELADDIFFLTREEVLAHCEGSSVTESLAELVELRRAEHACFEASAGPPERFSTVGSPRWQSPFPAEPVST